MQISMNHKNVRSDVLQTLLDRGFLHQCTDLPGLDKRLSEGPITAYNGFDLTADSLHVGHLIPIMMLRWFQKAGHRPIVLLGGATTRIGDPSFRDTSRPILDDAQIAANHAGIRQVFERFLTFDGGSGGATMVDNADWLSELRYLDFLRDFGRHFSVNRMLGFDSVRQRLDREQSLSLLEFNYMVMQAYDFLELSRTHSCALQLGASDQWGNIVNGVELARRVDGHEVFGLTAPLLATASGVKMGKSAGGAVWLNADRLPPYDFWPFWRNTEDADVGRFLRLFTEVPLDEVARLEALGGSEINAAKMRLADEVTTMCHGRAAAEAAHHAALAAFEGRAAPGMPTIEVAAERLEAGMLLTDLLLTAGLSSSKAEARRLIRGGGARVGEAVVIEDTAVVTSASLKDGVLTISAGRKRHVLVREA